MRLLVTGGAGFIGVNFIRYIMRETNEVSITNLDALTYAGNADSLRDLEDDRRYRFVQGDICDAELVDALMKRSDAVINFAAESHVDRSIEGPAEFLRTNVLGAGVVFDAARRHNIERVLHISTDEVYGSVDEPASCTELDPLAPNSPYSASKAGADLLARAYRQTYGFPISVTRTANNYGPYHFPEKVIPLFVTNLIDGGNVPLYGDGSNVRDWTYVGDNVEAQWLVLTEAPPGEIYNVGAGCEMSNLELTHTILEHFGLTGAQAEARIDYVEDRPGHDARYSVDTRRIRELGWRPRRTFSESLEDTITWYRENEAWWRPLKDAAARVRRGIK